MGYPPPGNFEVRQRFVRFEDSLLGTKTGKSEENYVSLKLTKNRTIWSKIYHTNLQMVDLQPKGLY